MPRKMNGASGLGALPIPVNSVSSGIGPKYYTFPFAFTLNILDMLFENIPQIERLSTNTLELRSAVKSTNAEP